MNVYEALYLMIAFAGLMIALVNLIVHIVRTDPRGDEHSRHNKNNRHGH